MKDKGFKTRLGEITKIKSQSGEPIELESGQVIINKVSTKQNLKKLVDINNDSTKKPTAKITDDGTAGGLLEGPAHYDANGNSLGGIKAIVDGNKQIEVEGKEFVVNKEASKKHWKELSKINQSAGNGVAIGPPADYDEDPKEFKDGGKVIDFNPNHVPSKKILNYGKKIKKDHPEIWKLGGNIFGNEAFENLKRVSERGYWLDSEEWMYIKWRSYVARHIHDFRIEGVIAMLKWVDKVEKGWPYMKNLIEEEIEKRQDKIERKMVNGGGIEENIINVSNYILERHPKKGDLLKGSKVDGFEIKKITKTVKHYGTIYELYLLKGSTKRIVTYIPKTKTITQFKKRPFFTKKGEYYATWDDGLDNKMSDGGSLTFKEKYNKKYGYSKDESHNLKEISEDTGVSTKGLQQIYNKGIGAYKTNPESVRPNVKSKEQWAKARIYSAVMGGKAAKVDAKELKMENGGGLNDCIYFIKNSEAIKNNGYYLEFKNLSIYIGSGDKVIPKIKSIFLITYNSGGQKNLKPIDTINSIELANKLANLLNVEIGVARIIVSEQVTHSKRFEINKINSLVNKNIIIADRDTIVCTNLPMKLSNGGLIAPNGKNSNLTPEQYKLVRTPEFKAWFGDWENEPDNASKVVDENGEPLVVFHGTKNQFYTFDKRARGSNTDPGIFGKGFYFSKNLQTSKNYGNYILETFLNIRNPFNNSEFKSKSEVAEYLDISEDILTEGGTGIKAYASFTGMFSDAIKEKGHDGVTTRFGEIVVFEPEQIKLADGTNTTFDSNNPDIRFEEGGLIAPNGKNSNLTPYQYKLVRTAAFKEWFGDWQNSPKTASKVTDENGEPLVVYHGTKSSDEFFEFKKEFSKTKWDTFWFSPNRETAMFYSKQNDKFGKVFECFLNVKNPSKTYPFDLEKYDGYIDYKNEMDYVNWQQSKIIQVIQVVNSNQIKLSDGSNTTFDSDNQDIRFENGGGVMGNKIYLVDFNKMAKSNINSWDYEHLTTIQEKRNAIKVMYANDFYSKNNITPIAEPDLDSESFLWQSINKNNSQYEISFHFNFAVIDVLKIEKVDVELFDENYNPIGAKMNNGGVADTFGKNNPDIRFENGGNVDYELVSTLNLNSIRNQDKSNWDYDLEKSIEKKGILEPVTIGYWPEEHVITLVDGHHRLDTAMDLGIEEIPTRIEKYYNYPYGKHRLYPVPRINSNATKPSDLDIYGLGGKIDDFNFTSYADAQVWMNENSKKFKNQNDFYASDEYKSAYPIIQQLYKVEQKSYAAKAQQAMVEANVKFGDKVNYDYITPFLQSEKYSGTIIERNGIPFVKLDDGQQTISGSKSVKWHKGWKKSKFENGGAIDKKDTLTLDVPLMIRLLELSREDIKSDAELHFLVEKLIELKNKPVLTMEDYAFIADLEHTHLKKFDLGGKVTDSEREVDLGFGGLGNGTTVWDRNRIENNDYKIVAHISNSGNVTYYDKNLTEVAKNKIEEMAMKEKQDFQNQNGLSSGYEFMPINTPLN
jgi:hypothetical protein